MIFLSVDTGYDSLDRVSSVRHEYIRRIRRTKEKIATNRLVCFNVGHCATLMLAGKASNKTSSKCEKKDVKHENTKIDYL